MIIEKIITDRNWEDIEKDLLTPDQRLEYMRYLIHNQVPMPDWAQRTVDKHFWDLF